VVEGVDGDAYTHWMRRRRAPRRAFPPSPGARARLPLPYVCVECWNMTSRAILLLGYPIYTHTHTFYNGFVCDLLARRREGWKRDRYDNSIFALTMLLYSPSCPFSCFLQEDIMVSTISRHVSLAYTETGYYIFLPNLLIFPSIVCVTKSPYSYAVTS